MNIRKKISQENILLFSLHPWKIKLFNAFIFLLKIEICILDSIFLPPDYHIESGGEKAHSERYILWMKKGKILSVTDGCQDETKLVSAEGIRP